MQNMLLILFINLYKNISIFCRGLTSRKLFVTLQIHGVAGGMFYILGGHSIGHSKQKLYMDMCPIPNGFRDTAISLYRGLAWAPSIVLPSRLAAPLSEACESV
jgi:hypothetical protein